MKEFHIRMAVVFYIIISLVLIITPRQPQELEHSTDTLTLLPVIPEKEVYTELTLPLPDIQNPLSAEYRYYLTILEMRYDLPLGIMNYLMLQESSGNPKAVSRVGAEGLFQFMPNTSRWLEVDPFDIYESAEGAARYLHFLITHFDNNLEHGLAAYNAGMGNVRRYGGIPPFRETRNYVTSITNLLQNHY